ncbi:hypothetical protein RUM44_009011 [Polyplax serrata]|uniref:HMG box domain-containing protein n=1 Tax=Polyplax serrata TaxID=468196 RepID=A0ABR1ARQ7_POLSC
MTGSSMLRLINGLSLLNIHTGSSHLTVRTFSARTALKKLGLPELPKRPKTSFLLYKEAIREDLKKTCKNEVEIVRVAAQNWKQLSQGEKEKYIEIYKRNVVQYKNDMQNFEDSLSSEQKNNIKEATADYKYSRSKRAKKQALNKRVVELKKPKRPLTSFFRFLQTVDKMKNESQVDFAERVAKMWHELPSAKKEEYIKKYHSEIELFNKELEQWEEHMIKIGNIDVVRSKTLKAKLKFDLNDSN